MSISLEDDIVKDTKDATPNTLTESELIKNANYLQKVWDIRTTSAADEGAMVFMARCFIQATLPHKDPGETRLWHRENGKFELDIKAAEVFDKQKKRSVSIGLPYGSIPRLLFIWMTTEALRTKETRLFMGNSLSSFIEKIGLGGVTGGANGTITRLKNQAYRTFRAEFTLTNWKDAGLEEIDIKVTNRRRIFWNPQLPEQGSLWESFIDLTPEFYNLIVNNPAPLDFRALHALKSSSLALDVYMWLSHRTFYLTEAQRLSWTALAGQLGSDYRQLKVLRHYVRQAVSRIKTFWPELKVDFDNPETITLYPSKPLITPKELKNGKLLITR